MPPRVDSLQQLSYNEARPGCDREIKRRRHRRDKMRKLRAQLEKTTDMRQRSVIIRKIKVVRPNAPVPEA